MNAPDWPQNWPRQPSRSSQPSRQRRGGVVLLLGVLFCGYWLIVQVVPVYHGDTLIQLNNLCSGGLGQVAQVFSSRASHDCQEVGKAVSLANPILIAAIVLLVAEIGRAHV